MGSIIFISQCAVRKPRMVRPCSPITNPSLPLKKKSKEGKGKSTHVFCGVPSPQKSRHACTKVSLPYSLSYIVLSDSNFATYPFLKGSLITAILLRYTGLEPM